VSEESLHSKTEEEGLSPEMEPNLVRRLSCRGVQLPSLAYRLAEEAEMTDWERKTDSECPQRPTSLALRIPPLIAITCAESA
ncbi:hypothetical protein NDU88_005166, partial [Pleurodeles waltl]